jgi:HSP20 family protein
MFLQLQNRPTFDASLEREINNFFDGWLYQGFEKHPPLNISETPNETIIISELPGVKKEEVAITMLDGILTISGERKAPQAAKESTLLRNEIGYGAFSRNVRIAHPVNLETISAELQNGVLRVVLPKAEEARPREITVK